jgi:hypothetical protein
VYPAGQLATTRNANSAAAIGAGELVNAGGAKLISRVIDENC